MNNKIYYNHKMTTLKFWDYAASDFARTPTGRIKVVKTGSPYYNKLISQGYTRFGNSYIWKKPTVAEIREKQAPAVEQYKRARIPKRPEVVTREPQYFEPLRESITKRRQEMKLLRPRAIKIRTDPFRGFKGQVYKLDDVGSTDSLYNMFENLSDGRKDTTAIMRFISSTGEPRYVTLTPEKMDTYDDFTDYIDKLSKGNIVGSDAIGDGTTIDTSYLATINFDIYGEGKCSEPFFINADEEKETSALCLWRAVFSQIQYDESRPVPKDITDLGAMVELLKDLYDCDLVCYCDYTKDLEVANSKYKKVVIDGKTMMAAPINVELKILSAGEHGCANCIYIAYYDAHFIKYSGLKPGQFYLDHTKKLLHVIDNKIVREVRRQKIVDRLKTDGHINEIGFVTKVITFDIETRYDESYVGLLRPYSISWTYDNNGYFYFGDNCVEKMLEFLMERSANTLFCLLGYNSSRFDNIFLLPAMLRMDILTSVFYQNNNLLNIRWGGRHTVHDICRFTLSSLDRAGKEFRTLFQKLGDFNHESVQSHFNRTGNVSSFFHDSDCKIGAREHKSDGEIFFIKYIASGTNDIIEDIEARKELSIMIDQRNVLRKANMDCGRYNIDIADTQDKILKNEEALNREKYVIPSEVKSEIIKRSPCKCSKYNNLITYNLFDVFSTEELYFGIEKVMKDNGAISRRLFDNKTIGSIIYRLFTCDVLRRIDLPAMDLVTYKRVRSGLFAGRTQCYKGVSFDLSRKNKYVMLDVKSLYPYVMLNRYFPAGQIIKINYSVCAQKDLIGFYNCKINQTGLNKNVIPRRCPKEPLNWNYKDDIVVLINTVDIKCLLDAGARVEILKDSDGNDDGIAFTGKVRGDDLFRVLVTWKNIKEEQDALKAQGKSYNVVLRNMAKAFLNSLSGKVIENIHLDATALVRTKSDMAKIICESKDYKKLQLNAILTPTAGLISYTRDEKKEFKRQNRPIYLGTLIYAYARDHMYRSILANYDVIYQDTDSALISHSEYERFKQEQPELLGEAFGQFALEDFSELFDSYITLSPKNYFIMGGVNASYKKYAKDVLKSDLEIGDYTAIKKGFKGVNLMRDKYIHNPSDFYEHIGKTMKPNNIIYDVNNKTGFELYTGEIDYSAANDMREVMGLPMILPPKTVYEDWERFINTILLNSCAYVLTSSLNKATRNVESSGISAGAIYQRYLIKKIKIDLNSANIPFEKPVNEMLLKLHTGRNSYDVVKIILPVNTKSDDVSPYKFWHSSMCKFEDAYVAYTDIGGERGNRAFNFKSYTEYVKSDLILSLMNAAGTNFYFNEYFRNDAIWTRLWLDIDMKISADKVQKISECIESIVDGGDNKVLQSTNGKLHIVLNIGKSQPVPIYAKVKVGRKYEFRATGEICHDSSEKGLRALMLFFKEKLRLVMGNDTYDEEWNRAFDMKAPGLRAPFSIKVVGGKCTARHFYSPINCESAKLSNAEKAKIILDCSIYKPSAGKIRSEYFEEIGEAADRVDKKIEKSKKKLLTQCKKYKYDGKNVIISGVKTTITQKFLDELIQKLPKNMLAGYHWRSVIIRLATISSAITFDPKYLLHTWSAQDSAYNEDGNNNTWQWARRNAKPEDVETALAWLISKSNYNIVLPEIQIVKRENKQKESIKLPVITQVTAISILNINIPENEVMYLISHKDCEVEDTFPKVIEDPKVIEPFIRKELYTHEEIMNLKMQMFGKRSTNMQEYEQVDEKLYGKKLRPRFNKKDPSKYIRPAIIYLIRYGPTSIYGYKSYEEVYQYITEHVKRLNEGQFSKMGPPETFIGYLQWKVSEC